MKKDLTAAVVAFLRARLDEDEKAARDATPGPWVAGTSSGLLVDNGVYGQSGGGALEIACDTREAGGYGKGNVAHIAHHDPARTLREVEATRGVLAIYDQMITDLEAPDLITSGMAPVTITVLTPVLCHLARTWSDHPDYQADAWKPII